jgi:membrane protease YdiL (CAAX protease family)
MSSNIGGRIILLYLFIVFSVSWLLIILIHLFGGLRTLAALGVYGLMMIPATIAFLMRKWVTREGFEGSGLRMGRRKYYLIAWLIPIATVYATYGVVALTGFGKIHLSDREIIERIKELGEIYRAQISVPEPPPGMSLTSFMILLAIGNITIFLIPAIIFGFGEEFGWRSYLLPKLLRFGRVKAFIIIGLIWWAWHLPLTILTSLPSESMTEVAILILLGIISTTLVGIILAWLFYASGSIFPAALAHITFNQANGTLAIFISSNPLALNLTLTITLTIITITLYKRGCIEVIGTSSS